MQQMSSEIDTKIVSELTERFMSADIPYTGNNSVIEFVLPIARKQVAEVLNTDIETLQPYLVTVIDNIAAKLSKCAAENVMAIKFFDKCRTI